MEQINKHSSEEPQEEIVLNKPAVTTISSNPLQTTQAEDIDHELWEQETVDLDSVPISEILRFLADKTLALEARASFESNELRSSSLQVQYWKKFSNTQYKGKRKLKAEMNLLAADLMFHKEMVTSLQDCIDQEVKTKAQYKEKLKEMFIKQSRSEQRISELESELRIWRKDTIITIPE